MIKIKKILNQIFLIQTRFFSNVKKRSNFIHTTQQFFNGKHLDYERRK